MFDNISCNAWRAETLCLPDRVLEVTQAIYCDRRFVVSDCGQTSQERQQGAGISQGCPLSPFLFVMVLDCLVNKLSKVAGVHCVRCFADDIALTVGDLGPLKKIVRYFQRFALMRKRCYHPCACKIGANAQIHYFGT